MEERTEPRPTLTVLDAVALIVGLVVGVGIFRTPPAVAANAGGEGTFLLAWLLGGLISLVGALCYAELATAYPHAGGDYHYLTRAFGKEISFLFAWARMTVIQTGSIAMLGFAFGDYASELLSLGPHSSSLYAALAVAGLTALNVMGVQQGKWTQNLLTAAKVVGLSLVVVVGIALAHPSGEPTSTDAPKTAFGMAMIFVLLTYGGWNEAAYISAELKEVRRNMVRALLWGVGLITAIYLLANLAYLKGLGLAGVSASKAVAAELMRQVAGDAGARSIGLLVAISALGAMNATIFTGARTNYAWGRDTPLLAFLGRWRAGAETPANALLAQGLIALALVLLGTWTRRGFETMVDYTAPVFWFFFLLTGLSLFVLRTSEGDWPRPFQVPLYPLLPLVFCATCLYMLHSSLAYTQVGAMVGVAVLLAGVPVLLAASAMERRRRLS